MKSLITPTDCMHGLANDGGQYVTLIDRDSAVTLKFDEDMGDCADHIASLFFICRDDVQESNALLRAAFHAACHLNVKAIDLLIATAQEVKIRVQAEGYKP